MLLTPTVAEHSTSSGINGTSVEDEERRQPLHTKTCVWGAQPPFFFVLGFDAVQVTGILHALSLPSLPLLIGSRTLSIHAHQIAYLG